MNSVKIVRRGRRRGPKTALAAMYLLAGHALPAVADENLFGYVTGVDTLPKGAGEVYTMGNRSPGQGSGRL